MVFRPIFSEQLDGSRCQGTNCNCASHAMAAHRHRRGVDPRNRHGWPPSPKEIRQRIDRYCPQTDLNQNEDAVRALYEVGMDVRWNVPFDSFRSLIQSGRGAVVYIMYYKVPSRLDACPGYGGGHAVYANDFRSGLGFLIGDPLADGRRRGIPKGWKWWPTDVLREAAQAFPGTNPGRIHASFTRDTD